jgi:hypothetical protein
MIWQWLRKRPRRKPLSARAERTRVRVQLEQLEDRLLPASMLDNFLPNFNDTAVPLYGGGTVSHLATLQTSGEPISLSETDSGTLGADATFSYTVEITGLTEPDGTASYEQEYVYNFDNTFVDSDGASIHEWGTYQYLFSISTTSVDTQFSFVAGLSYHQTALLSAETTATDGSTTSDTWTSELTQAFDREISNHTDFTDGSAQGSEINGGQSIANLVAVGTYTSAIPGGTMSGTFTQNSEAISGYTYELDATFLSDGTWNRVGNGTANSSGEEHSTYSGSGSYSTSDENSSATGTIAESGASNNHYSSNATYTIDAAGAWQLASGNASGGGDGSGQLFYAESTGTYADTADGTTLSGSSTQTGQASSTYSFMFAASPGAADAWNGTTTSTAQNHSTYSGTGVYTTTGEAASSSGTTTETGADNSQYSFSRDWTIDSSGQFDTTGGTRSASGDGFTNSTYTGTGSYTFTADGFTATGSSTLNGETSSDYSYALTASAGSDGLWTSTGTGTTNSGGEDHSSYTGTGTYSATTETSSITGTTTESGADHSSYASSTSYTIAADGSWQIASGTGSGNGNGLTESSYIGTGNYSFAFDGLATSGTFTQNGQNSSDYSFTFTATETTGGAITYAGSATANASGEDHSSYTGAGTYSFSDDTVSFIGATNDSGADDSSYSFATNYTITAEGGWQIADMTRSSSGAGLTDSSYTGTGNYSVSFDGLNASGSFTQNGQDSLEYSYTFAATQAAGGTITYSGSAIGNASGDDHSSYVGTGNYSFSGDTVSLTGTTTESGTDDSGYSFATNYFLAADGSWQIADMTGAGTSNGSAESSYAGSGTRALVSGAFTASDTFTVSGQTSSEYSETFSPTQVADGTWSLSGNGTSTLSGGDHSTYSSTGSYSITDENSASSGTITESGADNSYYQFSTAYTVGSDTPISSMTGSGGGDGFSQSSYTGTGTYTLVSTDVTGTGASTQSGQANSNYSYSFSVTEGVDGTLSFSGSALTNSFGEDHANYTESGSYVSGIIQGTFTESSSDDSSYEYTLTSTMDPAGDLAASSGAGSSQGNGTYSFAYSGSGSNEETTTSEIPDGTSTSTITESASESGQGSGTYSFSAASTVIEGAWATTATGTAIGSGNDNSTSDRVSSLTESTNASWSSSNGSYTSNSSLNQIETSAQTQEQSYDFSIAMTLAADGSLTTVTTVLGNGSRSGYHSLTASGSSDSVSDDSTEGATHSESEGSWSRTADQDFASTWQINATTTIGPSGTLTTGGLTGSTTANGSATYAAHYSGFTDSISTGPNSTTQSHSESSSNTNSSDNFDYTAAWFSGYDSAGVPNNTIDANNHVWGSFGQASSSLWSTTSTTTDPDTGETTTTTDGDSDNSTDETPYDHIVSTPGFAGNSADIGSGSIQYHPLGSGLVLGQTPPRQPGQVLPPDVADLMAQREEVRREIEMLQRQLEQLNAGAARPAPGAIARIRDELTDAFTELAVIEEEITELNAQYRARYERVRNHLAGGRDEPYGALLAGQETLELLELYLFGASFTPVAAAAAPLGAALQAAQGNVVAAALYIIPVAARMRGSSPIHHIGSRFANVIRAAREGWERPWAQMTQRLLRRAGIRLNDPHNLVRVPGHGRYAPHPELYHRRVYQRLLEAAGDLRGAARRQAILDELDRLATELRRWPSRLTGRGL